MGPWVPVKTVNMGPIFAAGDKESNMLLRVQFLTAYHASRTLRHCLASMPDWLEEHYAPVLDSKRLRNNLAHYGLGKAARYTLTSDEPLDAIIVGVANCTRDALVRAVQHRLSQISSLLQAEINKASLWPLRAVLGTHS